MKKGSIGIIVVIVIGFIVLLLLSDSGSSNKTSENSSISTSSDNEEVVNEEETNTFMGNECTSDCSGHEAGYEWAEEKGITDPDDCGGNSNSFIEGCESYAEEQSDWE